MPRFFGGVFCFLKLWYQIFAGFVLYLCHDLSSLITGSTFWYGFKSSSVICSVGGRKHYQFIVLIGELCQVGLGG